MSNFKSGLVASMEELDEQVIVAADVEDGDVDQMVQETIEEGNEVKENVSQAEEALQVIEALEAYQEMIQDSMQFGGLDRNQARAIEIGVQGLTRKFGIESADVVFSMESYDTPSSAMRSTQVSMEGVKDIIAKIRTKSKDFTEKAIASMAANIGRSTKMVDLIEKNTAKLLQEAQSKEFESKKLSSDKYGNLHVDGEFSPAKSVRAVSGFAKDFVFDMKWTESYANFDKEADEYLNSLKIDSFKVKDIPEIVRKFRDRMINRPKNEEVTKLTDTIQVRHTMVKDDYIFEVEKTKASNKQEVDSLTQNEAVSLLTSLSKEIAKLKEFNKDDMHQKMAKRLGLSISTESEEAEPNFDDVTEEQAESAVKRFLKKLLKFSLTVTGFALIGYLAALFAPAAAFNLMMFGLVIHVTLSVTAFAINFYLGMVTFIVSAVINTVKHAGQGVLKGAKWVGGKLRKSEETVSTESLDEVPEKEIQKAQQIALNKVASITTELFEAFATSLTMVVDDVHRLVKDSM